ncbi:MAG: metallophosphoesterase [Ignavibacterium sp.]|nr:MAG: metallophosphoesterase [Ignavibacterium sp.]
MLKLSCAFIATSLILTACGSIESGIPKEVGDWRVEVGPPGNEFYQAPVFETIPPSEDVLQLVWNIAPQHAKVSEWEQNVKDIYFIRAKARNEEYDFILGADASLFEVAYENDSTKIKEEADRLVLKGSKKSIELSEVPQSALQTISKVFPDSIPKETWIASTVSGERYVIVVGQTVFYARPDGQIQAAGLTSRGALNEVDPSVKKKNREEIVAEAKQKLAPYRERFNIQKRVDKLVNEAASDNGYRFVVIGDTRSNPDLWFNVVKHVNQLDPKPEFVISTGDIVRYGYTEEYLDYFIPPLLETELNYFVAIGNHDDGSGGKAFEYRYLFGENALNYFFDYGKCRYIFFDNVSKVNPYEESLEWLNNVLASTPKDHKIIVSAHKPIATVEKWAYHAWNRRNSDTFAELMSIYKVDHVFFGHIHAYSTATFNSVPYTITGGGGAGLHDRYGPLGNVHNYVICDVMPDGSMEQKVVRFYKKDDQ